MFAHKFTKHFPLILTVFALLLGALFFAGIPEKFPFSAQAQVTTASGITNPYSPQAPVPQNVRDVPVFGTDLFNTASDSSFTNSGSSNTYALNINNKLQNFLITAVYGPNPCSPISEGGNAYYAISISPQASLSDRYVYAPKNVAYKVEFRDFQGNILETIQSIAAVDYKQSGSGSGKKITGWIYGFHKPEKIKSQIGERRFRMAYQIWFTNNNSGNIMEFDLLAHKMTPIMFAKNTRNKNYNKNYSDKGREKHKLISYRGGGDQEAVSGISYAPAPGTMQEAGAGINPTAAGVTMGYPIDIVSGSLVDDYVDMALPGGTTITRQYNSGMGSQPGRAFGWMFNFEEILRFDPDGSVFYRDSNFKEYRFAPGTNAALNYVPNATVNYLPAKPGNFLKMTRDAQGNYEVIFKDQSKKVFNSFGLLIKTIDSNGNIISYMWELPMKQIRETYDVPAKLAAVMGPADSFRANRVLTITDPYNRSVCVYFNKLGRVGRIVDWAGRTTEYTWDDKEGVHLVKYKDIGGNCTDFVYDSNDYNKLTEVASSKGALIKNSYASSAPPNSQAVIGQTLANGGFISYNYGWLKSPQERWTVINNNGKISTYYYDENGSITKIIAPGADNTQITYTFTFNAAKNQLISVTDSLGRTTSYSYDEKNNAAEIKLPNGKIVKFKYDALDRVTDYWDTAGRRTGYVYDTKGNLLSIEKRDGTKIFFEYDARGNLVKTINENGNSVLFEYGIYGDLVKISDEEGGTALFYRDTLGRVVETNINGLKNKFSCNNFNLPTQITDALGNGAKISYDSDNNITSIVDAKGNDAKFEYNMFGQLTRFTGPDDSAQSYRYDSSGNLISIIDPMGGGIGFEYNGAGYLTSLWDQNMKRTHYSYDADGNLITASVPLAGKGVELRYDDINRLIQKIADNTANYEYDEKDNVKRVKDNSGETVYEYDAMDRVTKKSYPFGGAAYECKYDKAGNVVYEKQINGAEFYYQYDKADKLLSVTKKDGGILLCKYNQGRDLAAIEYPSGINAYIAYNENKNIVRMKYISSKTGEVIYEVNYGYDELDRAISKKESSSLQMGKEITYGYDKAGRLNQVSSDGVVISEYTYDKNGNRLTSRTLRGIAQYSYDSANRLLKMSKTAYEYDDAGNVISANDGSEIKTYQYDKENNLTSIKSLGANKKETEISYGYNAADLRISMTSPGNNDKTFACWLDGQLLGEVKANGEVKFINYGYGFENEKGDNYYYIRDPRNGSVVMLTNNKGKPVTYYGYDVFGEPLSTINMAEESQPAAEASPATPAPAAPVSAPSTPAVSAPATPALQAPVSGTPVPVAPAPVVPAPTITPSAAPATPVSQGQGSAGGTSTGGTSSGGTSAGGTSSGGTSSGSSGSSGSQTPSPYNPNIFNTPMPTPEETKTSGAAAPVPMSGVPQEIASSRKKEKPALRPIQQAPSAPAQTPQTEADKTKKPSAKPTASPLQRQYQITPTPAGTVMPSPAPSTDVGARRAAPKSEPGVIKKVINSVINFFKNLFGKKKTSQAGVLLSINDFIKNLLSKDNIYKPVKTAGIAEFIKSLFGGGTSGGEQSNKIESPIRFAGYYYDKDTGLYYVQSRYYDPETGRFTQADKISYAGGLNLYAYCDNDPVNYVDPLGLQSTAPLPVPAPNPNSVVDVIKTAGKGIGVIGGSGALVKTLNTIFIQPALNKYGEIRANEVRSKPEGARTYQDQARLDIANNNSYQWYRGGASRQGENIGMVVGGIAGAYLTRGSVAGTTKCVAVGSNIGALVNWTIVGGEEIYIAAQSDKAVNPNPDKVPIWVKAHKDPPELTRGDRDYHQTQRELLIIKRFIIKRFERWENPPPSGPGTGNGPAYGFGDLPENGSTPGRVTTAANVASNQEIYPDIIWKVGYELRDPPKYPHYYWCQVKVVMIFQLPPDAIKYGYSWVLAHSEQGPLGSGRDNCAPCDPNAGFYQGAYSKDKAPVTLDGWYIMPEFFSKGVYFDSYTSEGITQGIEEYRKFYKDVLKDYILKVNVMKPQ